MVIVVQFWKQKVIEEWKDESIIVDIKLWISFNDQFQYFLIQSIFIRG